MTCSFFLMMLTLWNIALNTILKKQLKPSENKRLNIPLSNPWDSLNILINK